MRRSAIAILVGGLVVVAIFPACSLFESEPPRALSVFHHSLRGIDAECCDWVSEETVIGVVSDSVEINEGLRWVEVLLTDSSRAVRISHMTLDQISLRIGEAYLFENTFIPINLVNPNPSSLRITHNGELLLFGSIAFPASGIDVLLSPEGWSFHMDNSDHGEYSFYCVTGIKPQTLVVRHGNDEVRLVQGQTKRLGDYMIQARVAQLPGEWDGETECPTDVLIPELSFVIWKVAG